MSKQNQYIPSYLDAENPGPWGIFLEQVDRVAPYLGEFSEWGGTVK